MIPRTFGETARRGRRRFDRCRRRSDVDRERARGELDLVQGTPPHPRPRHSRSAIGNRHSHAAIGDCPQRWIRVRGHSTRCAPHVAARPACSSPRSRGPTDRLEHPRDRAMIPRTFGETVRRGRRRFDRCRRRSDVDRERARGRARSGARHSASRSHSHSHSQSHSALPLGTRTRHSHSALALGTRTRHSALALALGTRHSTSAVGPMDRWTDGHLSTPARVEQATEDAATELERCGARRPVQARR